MMNLLNWVSANPWMTGIILVLFFGGIEECIRAARGKRS
jgi:hypothetical protein